MPQWIRGPELIIILVIIVLLFGVGRIRRTFSELGQGIREFRNELKGDDGGAEFQSEDDGESKENNT